MITWLIEGSVLTLTLALTRGQAWALIVVGIILLIEVIAGSSLLAIILTH